jgi:hypothetical protein
MGGKENQAVTLSLRPVTCPWEFTNGAGGLASGVFCATASLGLLASLLAASGVRLGAGVGATGVLLTDATSMDSSGVEAMKFMREGLAVQAPRIRRDSRTISALPIQAKENP